MAMQVGKGQGSTPLKTRREKLDHKIVIDEVVIQERTVKVDIPKVNYVDKTFEVPKVNFVDEDTTRFNVVEKDTTKYNVVNKDTIKFNTIEERTTRYVPEVVKCEKPVLTEVAYEKPVVTEKSYEVHSVKNIQEVIAFNAQIKQLNEELPKLIAHLKELREFKLVEKIIQVPKVEYHTVKVERIEWIPIRREKEGLIFDEGKDKKKGD